VPIVFAVVSGSAISRCVLRARYLWLPRHTSHTVVVNTRKLARIPYDASTEIATQTIPNESPASCSKRGPSCH
jgi:hypothetical protein